MKDCYRYSLAPGQLHLKGNYFKLVRPKSISWRKLILIPDDVHPDEVFNIVDVDDELNMCNDTLLGRDYMTPDCQDEILTSPTATDFTIQLHVKIKFRPSKTGQFSTWHFIRSACIFFAFFFVNMSFYRTEDS